MRKKRAEKKAKVVILIGTAVILVFAGLGQVLFKSDVVQPNQPQNSTIDFPDIHGLGYSNDGLNVIVATHTGLRIYENGRWSKPDSLANDYMGFTAVDNGFYSSGHPGQTSVLTNPLGIVKSEDKGKTLQSLGLVGESDFHIMGVGYRNHTIYVYNEFANSQMQQGLYYSKDDTKTWLKAVANGMEGEPYSIAVDPSKSNVVVVGTDKGAFLSIDYGQTFRLVSSPIQITSVAFDPAGNRLLAGGWNDGARFLDLTFALKGEGKEVELSIPDIGKDAIGYLAINPKDSKEVFISTYNKNIFFTQDDTKTWRLIAKEGIAD